MNKILPGGGFLLLVAICFVLALFLRWGAEPIKQERHTQLYLKGFTHFYNERYDAAAADFKKLVTMTKESPKSGRYNLFLARALFQQGKYENSFQTLRTALQYDCDNYYLAEFALEMTSGDIPLLKLSQLIKEFLYKKGVPLDKVRLVVGKVAEEIKSREVKRELLKTFSFLNEG